MKCLGHKASNTVKHIHLRTSTVTWNDHISVQGRKVGYILDKDGNIKIGRCCLLANQSNFKEIIIITKFAFVCSQVDVIDCNVRFKTVPTNGFKDNLNKSHIKKVQPLKTQGFFSRNA